MGSKLEKGYKKEYIILDIQQLLDILKMVLERTIPEHIRI